MGKRGPPPEKLAALFKLKYIQRIINRRKLAEMLGVKENTVSWYSWYLKRKLTKAGLDVSSDQLRFICPDCLEAKVYEDPENGERVCTSCGTVEESVALTRTGTSSLVSVM